MAAFRTLGDWLEDSGWTDSLVHAGIATSGKADSFLKASHLTRTRHIHQVITAAIYTLQMNAYDSYSEDGRDGLLDFSTWCIEMGEKHVQFKYWSITLELQLLILMFVRSLRTSSFDIYVNCLEQLAPWFCALDHTHYSRYIPVHICDMKELKTINPTIAK